MLLLVVLTNLRAATTGAYAPLLPVFAEATGSALTATILKLVVLTKASTTLAALAPPLVMLTEDIGAALAAVVCLLVVLAKPRAAASRARVFDLAVLAEI